MAVRNVIFDFGGVLLDWNPRHLYRPYFNDEAEMEYFLANICTFEWNAENDRGVPMAENVARLQRQFPEYAEPIAMFKSRWDEMLRASIPEGVALLKEVKRRGYRLYGLTNWEAETIGVAYERYDFFSLFDGIVVSGEEHVIKPEPEIYRRLLDRYRLRADECLFIDDNAQNIEAALALGFAAVRFDNPATAPQRILALLDENDA